MSLFGRMKKKREPVVVSGLDKTHRVGESCELKIRGLNQSGACIVSVGKKGSGKTATISRFDVTPVDSTNNCILYQPNPGSGPDALKLPWVEESIF